MVHSRRRAVEHEVAGLQRRTVGDVRAGVVLGVRGARQGHARARVAEGRQARAVEPGVAVRGSVAAPHVGQADLGERRADGGGGTRVGGVRGERGLAQLRGRHRGGRRTVAVAVVAVAAAVAVASRDEAIVGRIGITAAGLNGRAVGSRSSGSGTAAGPGVRAVGDRHRLRDGDRGRTHRRAEAGNDQDRGQRPSRDRGATDADAPGAGITAGVGAPVLIVVGHLAGSPTALGDLRLEPRGPMPQSEAANGGARSPSSEGSGVTPSRK